VSARVAERPVAVCWWSARLRYLFCCWWLLRCGEMCLCGRRLSLRRSAVWRSALPWRELPWRPAQTFNCAKPACCVVNHATAARC